MFIGTRIKDKINKYSIIKLKNSFSKISKVWKNKVKKIFVIYINDKGLQSNQNIER